MMDFMNENSLDDDQQQKPSLQESLVDDDGLELDDDVDNDNDSQQQEYLTTSVQGSNVKKGTIVLCAVFAVGAAALFFMIKKSTPQAASAQAIQQSSKIDTAIAKLSGIKADIFDRMDGIAKKFDEFSNIQQVGVGELQRNPFRKHNWRGRLPSGFGMSESELSRNAGSLQLDSIAKSQDGSFCMIDGKVLFEGDVIDGYKIVKIGSNSVEIGNGSATRVLKITMP